LPALSRQVYQHCLENPANGVVSEALSNEHLKVRRDSGQAELMSLGGDKVSPTGYGWRVEDSGD